VVQGCFLSILLQNLRYNRPILKKDFVMKRKYLKINTKETITFIRAGHFISNDLPWFHPDRDIDTYEIIIISSGQAFLQQGSDKYIL